MCIYTTTDNDLRWEYLRTKKLPRKLTPAVTKFDGLMARISRLRHVDDRTPIYHLLGKCLFAALDSNLEYSVTSYYRPVVDVIREFEKSRQSTRSRSNSNRVFIVHGHDGATKESVARFLTNLKLDPIILHERASKGRTIIEKFENESDVAFAVVLLTPDDVGATKADKKKLKPRSRQNVVFELGFFVAALGRTRVVALHTGDVELPSDVSGVIYVPFDAASGWKLLLARELKHGGLKIDMNDAVK